MANSYHELAKEPNRNVLFETVLKFMAKRISDKERPGKAFGNFDPKTEVNVAK